MKTSDFTCFSMDEVIGSWGLNLLFTNSKPRALTIRHDKSVSTCEANGKDFESATYLKYQDKQIIRKD